MAIKPIEGFYVHDEETNTDGVAKVSIDAVHEFVEDVSGAVVNWLDEHPEATTTVEDGAITDTKLNGEFLQTVKNAYVTPEMFGAKGDGETDDYAAFNECLNSGQSVLIPSKSYYISKAIVGYDCEVVSDMGTYTYAKPIYKTEWSFDSFDQFELVKIYELPIATSYIECCAYDTKRNKLVCAANVYTSSPYTTQLIVINPSTYNIENTYTFSFSIANAMSYNADTDEFLVCCYTAGSSADEGVNRVNAGTFQYVGKLVTPDDYCYYVYDSTAKAYLREHQPNKNFTIFDADLNELKTIPYTLSDGAQQDYKLYDGKIFHLAWHSLSEIDTNGNVNRLATDSMMEPEGFCLTQNGDGYFCCHVSGVNGIEYLYKFSKSGKNKNSYSNFQNSPLPTVTDMRLNNFKAQGRIRANIVNLNTAQADFPSRTSDGIVENDIVSDASMNVTYIKQTFYMLTEPREILLRWFNGSSWGYWYKYDADEINHLRNSTGNTNAILTNALTRTYGRHFVAMSSTNSGVNELPADAVKWRYSYGEIYVRDPGKDITVMLHAFNTADIAINTATNGNWTGWTIK